MKKSRGCVIMKYMEKEILIAKRVDKKIYREGDKLIKLFDRNYSKSAVLNEALNQSRVEETGLNIPKIDEVKLVDGKWAIVMDYIEGETLADKIEKNPADTKSIMSDFIDLHLLVHSKKCTLLTKYKDKMITKIMNCELDASTRYDLSICMNSMPMHNHLCHGDFIPSNIVITKDGTPYILDWAHASQGNATADAAKTYLLLMMDKREDLANEYVEQFLNKTGFNKEYIKAWIPLVSAAQLLTATPEKKIFLMSVINKYYES